MKTLTKTKQLQVLALVKEHFRDKELSKEDKQKLLSLMRRHFVVSHIDVAETIIKEFQLLRNETLKTKMEKPDWYVDPVEAVTVKNPVTEVAVKNFPDFPEQKEFPTEIKVTNFPDAKEFPTEFKVVNFPDQKEFPTSMKIEGEVKVEKQDNTEIFSFISAVTAQVISFLGKLATGTFKTAMRDEDFLTPQTVALWNPYTKQYVDLEKLFSIVNVSSTVTPSISVSGGGNANISGIVSPTEKYRISDADEVGSTKYYGFIDVDGNWYIMQNDTAANIYRYIRGGSGYGANWTGRAGLMYGYFNDIF